MNTELKSFLKDLKEGSVVHFVVYGVVIDGKFSKVEGDSVVLSTTNASGERFAGETKIDIEKIGAWGLGGKHV